MDISAQLVKELRERSGVGMMDCKQALQETSGNIEAAITWLREKGISKAAKKQSRIAAEGLCSVVENGNTAILFELNSETDFVSKNETFLSFLGSLTTLFGKELPSNDAQALALTLNGKTVETLISELTFTIGEKISLRRVTNVKKTNDQVFGSYVHGGGRIVTVVVANGSKAEVAKDIAMHVAAINPQYVDQSQVPAEEIQKEKAILTQEALNEGKPKEIVEKMVLGRINKFLKDICLLNQPFVKNPDVTVEQYLKPLSTSVGSFVRLAVGEGIEKIETDFAAEVAAQVGK
jgi:elongation factor Ts